jgi:hypothetical protein
VIDKDFAFHGNKAANRLRNLHDHGAARGAAGTNRTKQAGAGPAWGAPGSIPTAGRPAAPPGAPGSIPGRAPGSTPGGTRQHPHGGAPGSTLGGHPAAPPGRTRQHAPRGASGNVTKRGCRAWCRGWLVSMGRIKRAKWANRLERRGMQWPVPESIHRTES